MARAPVRLRKPGAQRAARASWPGDALWDGLGDCHRLLRAELREVVGRRGVYLAEYRALSRFQKREYRLADLAESLGQTPASVTDLARQLESRGWATRRRDPVDRRAFLLATTERGRQAHRTCRSDYRGRLDEVYRQLTPEARRALAQSLPELRRLLEERRRATS